jgi:DNA-binding NarL/FixJ family response regulator
MPGGGIKAAREISTRLPRAKVVMLTVSDADRDLLAALRAGASGYLLKEIDPKRLPRTLLRALGGEAAVSRELVGHLVEQIRDRRPLRRAVIAQQSDRPELTSREWQVLDLLRQDLSTAEIARRLVLSPVTVRTHIAAILRKLDVADREALVERFRGR